MSRLVQLFIDSDDLTEMFYDRVNYWSDKIAYGDDGAQLFCDYYAENVADGVYDGMKNFNIAVIVDNDIINEIDVVDETELAERGIDPYDDEDGRILFSNGELFLISARG